MPLEETTNDAPTLDIETTAHEIAQDLHLIDPVEEEQTQETTEQAAEQAAEPQKETGEKPGAASPQQAAPSQAQAPAEAAPSPVPDQPPDTWRKEAKEAWAALPPGIKEEVRKREADISRYVSETKDAVHISKAFEKIVEPYVPFFQQNNIDPWKYTQSLIGTHMSLLYGSPEQKQAALSTLAAQAGFRLPYTQQQGQLQHDPAQHRINQLEAELREMRQGVTSVTSAVQEARLIELEQAVVAFAKDESHPFFDEVADHIHRLISQGAAPTLEDAYNIAVNANPVTRQKLVDLAIEKRTKNLSDLQKARAVKAARAAQVNVQSTRRGGRAPDSTVGSIDDTLREAMAEINSRS